MAKTATSDEAESFASGPGVALRELRRTNGWTLSEISARTGVTISTLSRIENGHVSPTYDILMRLSRGLGIDLADLLSGTLPSRQIQRAQPGRRSLNRAGSGEPIDFEHHSLKYLSTDLLGKQITPILAEYRATSLDEFGPFMQHPGEEYLYVLEGKLEFHTECYAPVVLEVGDSIYFDSRMGHAYVARELPCRALSICTADIADEQAARPPAENAGARKAGVTPLKRRSRP